MNKKRNRNFGENGFEDWGGYMAAKKAKLQDQFTKHATKEGIFKGVAIHVNGYTVPTAEELKRIMMDNGGTYHHYYSTEKTTHIIATNLPDVKIKQLKSLHIKVVKPDWISASLTAGELLDYRDFLLYTHQSTTQPCLNFEVTASTSKNERPLTDSEHCKSTSPAKISENDTNFKQTATKHARTAVEPNFLSEFYSNSRLHHISTMGATFKQYVSQLRQSSTTDFPGLKSLKEWMTENHHLPAALNCYDDLNLSIEEALDAQVSLTGNRVIMHIDMDCFFVSVGIRDRPDLKGVPVAVTHSKGNSGRAREGADIAFERNYYKQRREATIKTKTGQVGEVTIESRIDDLTEHESLSEIASCSYEARRAGVKNGMFMGTAIKLCPDLKTIPYDFEGYKEVSRILYDTVASYTLDIEAVSCDEMFVDCTNLLKETGATPLQFASCLRAQIKEKTRCPASAGFGSNRLLARLATKKAKPDGQFYLEERVAEEHMKSIKVGDLPGVGHSMVYRLRALGISTCEDLQKFSLEQLRLEGFGTKTAEALYSHCRGKDERPLTFAQERKSVSAEINYGIRFENNTEAEDFLRRLSSEVHSRLAGDGARSITLKLMVRAKDAPTETAKFMGHGVCDNLTRSSSLARAVRSTDAITKEVLNLYKGVSCKPSDLRGIGIQLSRLEKGSSSDSGALDGFLVKRSEIQAPTTPKKSVQESRFEKTPDKPKTPAKSPSAGNSKSPAGRKNHKNAYRPDTKTIKDFMKPRKKSPEKMKFEVDPDVLAELPEDIRHEILEEYSKNAKELLNDCQTPAPPSQNESNTSSLLDVTFSQVDPQYLNELPPDLRREIETGLRIESQRKHQRQKQHGNQKTDVQLSKALTPDPTQDPEKSLKEPVAESKPVDRSEASSSRESLRDLISASNLKALVRSWIESTQVPQKCDVEIVSEFLHEMITSRDIDSLASIMRAIYRNICKRPNPEWRDAYSRIASNIQMAMLAVYEARLDVHDFVH